jgi:hypothetical protein
MSSSDSAESATPRRAWWSFWINWKTCRAVARFGRSSNVGRAIQPAAALQGGFCFNQRKACWKQAAG